MIHYLLCLSLAGLTVCSLRAQDCTLQINPVGGSHVDCYGGSEGVLEIEVNLSGITCQSNFVVINEILYRPTLNDGMDFNTGEMIELIAPPGTNIGCYVLTDGDWTITIPPNTLVPADGLFTIGNDAVYGNGSFDLDAENCNCFTEGTAGGSLMILTDGGEYLSLFDQNADFLEGLIYGTPSTNNRPPFGVNATSAGVIQTVGLSGCPASVTIPTLGFEQHIGGVPFGTSLIRSPDGTGTWTQQTGGSINDCNAPAPLYYDLVWNTGDSTLLLDSLPAGNYTVIATANQGCADTLTLTVVEPDSIGAIFTPIPENCNIASGAIQMHTTGGVPAYTYRWSNGATTEDIGGLFAGDYTVTITDMNQCTNILSVIVPNTIGLSATDSAVNAPCANTPSGHIHLFPAGGTPPYSYQWNNGATTPNNANIAAGAYTVTITDVNNCIYILNTAISQPPLLSLSLDSRADLTCTYTADGQLQLSATGGAGGYTYQWADGNGDAHRAGLDAGSYSVTLSDANGCQVDSAFAIAAPPPLLISFLSGDSVIGCDQVADAQVAALVQGGGGALAVRWADGSNDPLRLGLGAGMYALTLTDARGCIASDSFRITALLPAQADISLSSGTEQETAFVQLAQTQNAYLLDYNPALTYTWMLDPAQGLTLTDSSSQQLRLQADAVGLYRLLLAATSADGCTASDTLWIDVPENFLGLPDAFTPNGDGLNDRFRPVHIRGDFIVAFQIFNRFGNSVYADAALSDGGWDGTIGNAPAPRDTYFYILTYQTPFDTQPTTLRGELMLVR